ncbi:MAG: response regulator [Acidobacteriota bacterium]
MKILVVDDDAPTRLVLRRLLGQQLRCEVVDAANGMVALDLVNREAPDLVLLDLQMPGMDGIEVLHTLRTWRHTQQLPVIVLTSETDESVVRRCLAKGVSGYLAKPLQPSHVAERIRRLLPPDAQGEPERQAS